MITAKQANSMAIRTKLEETRRDEEAAKVLRAKYAKEKANLRVTCEDSIREAAQEGKFQTEVATEVSDMRNVPSYFSEVEAEFYQNGFSVTNCFNGDERCAFYCINISWS